MLLGDFNKSGWVHRVHTLQLDQNQLVVMSICDNGMKLDDERGAMMRRVLNIYGGVPKGGPRVQVCCSELSSSYLM